MFDMVRGGGGAFLISLPFPFILKKILGKRKTEIELERWDGGFGGVEKYKATMEIIFLGVEKERWAKVTRQTHQPTSPLSGSERVSQVKLRKGRSERSRLTNES